MPSSKRLRASPPSNGDVEGTGATSVRTTSLMADQQPAAHVPGAGQQKVKKHGGGKEKA